MTFVENFLSVAIVFYVVYTISYVDFLVMSKAYSLEYLEKIVRAVW